MNHLDDLLKPSSQLPSPGSSPLSPVRTSRIARRDFLKTSAAIGGGLCIAAYVPELAARPLENTPADGTVFAPNAFVRVTPDDSVTVIVNHSEMGQGIYTSLAMLLNEELGADWSKIKVEAAPVDAAYNHTVNGIQMTGGSTTTPSEWERFRKMGAMARLMLLDAAAQQWGVAASECRVEKGLVLHAASGRKATYGSLVTAASQLKPPANIPLKDPRQFTLVGKPTRRLDTPSKINGTAQFGLDVRLPGMLFAVVARPPVFGGKVISFDAAEALKIKGVRAVEQIPSGVAVVADRFWSAKLAREKLKISWNDGENASLSTSKMLEDFSRQSASPGIVAKKAGDPAAALAAAAKTITAEYDVPYLAHAMMEPLNCVVDLRADSCEIWTGTQFETVDRANAAQVAGLPPEKVQIHTTLLGGGFGRRANPVSDFVVEATHVAKIAKAPVKVVWTREEEFTWAYFRPAGVIEVKSGIAADGKLTAWEFHNYHSGMSGIETPYDVANQLTQYHQVPLVLRSGSYRGLAATANHFARETHMDALAHAAKMDPLDFRLKNLSNLRVRVVLEAATKSFGWPRQKTQEGQGFGLACGAEKGSYVAACAEVAVDRASGGVRVVRVVEAFECGAIVNPDGLRNQVTGAIIQGLGGALFEAVEFENGRIKNPHFATYRVPRFRDVPVIEAVLLDRKDLPSAGAGETPIMAIAPAVGNALFDSTGIRLNDLPLVPNGLRKA